MCSGASTSRKIAYYPIPNNINVTEWPASTANLPYTSALVLRVFRTCDAPGYEHRCREGEGPENRILPPTNRPRQKKKNRESKSQPADPPTPVRPTKTEMGTKRKGIYCAFYIFHRFRFSYIFGAGAQKLKGLDFKFRFHMKFPP